VRKGAVLLLSFLSFACQRKVCDGRPGKLDEFWSSPSMKALIPPGAVVCETLYLGVKFEFDPEPQGVLETAIGRIESNGWQLVRTAHGVDGTKTQIFAAIKQKVEVYDPGRNELSVVATSHTGRTRIAYQVSERD
jgi:hypothetical protein